MDVIVCFTPLQVLIAQKVMEIERVDRDSCLFLYFSNLDNKKHRYYFNLLSEKAKKSFFIEGVYSFRLILRLWYLLRKVSCDRVFLGSIDDSISHYVLSYMSFNQLVTFDDGIGNIVKTSNYFKEDKRVTLKKKVFTFIHMVLGRKFYLSSLKIASCRHYTIYKDYANCFPNAEYINVFGSDENILRSKDGNNKKIKHIILGTMYSEIAVNSLAENEIKKKLLNFMNEFSEKLVYIPHPRAFDKEFKEYEIDNLKISEEYIFDEIKKGYHIKLYGFSSSTQFNLLYNDSVENYIFRCVLFRSVMDETHVMLQNVLPEENFIDLQ